MYSKIFCILAGVFIPVSFVQANAISFVTPCKAEDSKCLTDNIAKGIPVFANGIPDLGLAPLDPIIIKSVDISKPGLNLIISDAALIGFRECQSIKTTRDAEKRKLFVEMLCDGKMNGNYEMSGELLFIPVNGKGPLRIEIKKILHNIEFDMGEKVGSDGKKYWDITKWDNNYDLQDTVNFVFGNLFNGNRSLSEPVEKKISLNGKEIMQKYGAPMVRTALNEIIQSVQIFFNSTPIEDLTLP